MACECWNVKLKYEPCSARYYCINKLLKDPNLLGNDAVFAGKYLTGGVNAYRLRQSLIPANATRLRKSQIIQRINSSLFMLIR